MSIEAFKDQAHTAAEITDEVNAQLPEEKATLTKQLAQTGKDIAAGINLPTSGDGRGQACLSVPPLAYHRWNLIYPGCFKNKEFADEWAIDNPECVLPGYKPKAKTMYFDMGARVPVSAGATFYHDHKAKVLAQIEAAERAVREFKT